MVFSGYVLIICHGSRLLCTHLCPLQDFLYTTTRISQSNTPLLHEVIPLIDSLTGAMEDVVDSMTASDIIRLAAARGRQVLNKYYSKTDESIMYRLAMSKCKLSTLSLQ